MSDNVSFYKFMHTQLLVVMLLVFGTAPGYIVVGTIYGYGTLESLWFFVVSLVSLYGYKLYKNFDINMNLDAKESWLRSTQLFMFIYFSLWSIIFVIYVLRDNYVLHYIAIATQLGSSVVAATILASQKKLVITIVITLTLPLTLYFIFVGEAYSYMLAFFSVVLAGVLLYAAKNTHEYLKKSRFQAYHDYLTGLGNRRYFLEILENFIQYHGDKYSYLLMIDLDYFKTINDTLGHDIGDALLQEVANRMKSLSNECGAKVARLGGDEFCILSENYLTQNECFEMAEIFSNKLLESIKSNYNLDGNNLYISASIGVSIINNRGVDAAEFLKEADMAMYEAKNSGRDGIIIFNEELCALVQEKLEIERLLHFSIEKNEISLVYQPQLNKYNQLIGCEVLVRWNSSKIGAVRPDVFIPMAENTGYIIELGEYILEESLKSVSIWSQKNIGLEHISINISMRQLLNQEFANTVERLFSKYSIEESNIAIIFEITESSAADDLSTLVKVIENLKKYNISFSMDDFGTGYSSLSYLREIPIEELKIDQSFVANLDDIQKASLVKSIIEISKNLNLSIVAEGVEEEYQREFLIDLDCDLFQGYLFSKPLSKEEFEQYYLGKAFS